jgi:amino-acid N-acetyltransferase
MAIVIQPATISHVAGIAALVENHAKRGQVLPRTVAEVRASIDDWVVAIDGETVLACCSLITYSPTLSEIRSVVVADQVKREGLGTLVVEAIITQAQLRGVRTLFALTRINPFFERVGFQQTSKAHFPEKVWRDCSLCPIQDDCDEFAVVLSLNGAGERDFKS